MGISSKVCQSASWTRKVAVLLAIGVLFGGLAGCAQPALASAPLEEAGTFLRVLSAPEPSRSLPELTRYKDPASLFTILRPDEWETKRTAGRTQQGWYGVEVAITPDYPDAGESKSVDRGLFVSLRLSPRGMLRDTTGGAHRWVYASLRRITGKNGTVTDSSWRPIETPKGNASSKVYTVHHQSQNGEEHEVLHVLYVSTRYVLGMVQYWEPGPPDAAARRRFGRIAESFAVTKNVPPKVPHSVSYLSAREWNMVKAANRARTHPDSVAEQLAGWRPFYNGRIRNRPGHPRLRTREGVAALNEAIRFLRAAEPRERLRPSRGMSKAAQDHANDLGETGRMSHTGSEGSQIDDRLARYGSWTGLIAENIASGDKTGREMVYQLIIDDGVPSRGHRKNLFEKRHRRIGVGCAPHPRYDRICVMTLAANYQDTTDARSGEPADPSPEPPGERQLTTYTDPEGMFSVRRPQAWTVKRQATRLRQNYYLVQMAATSETTINGSPARGLQLDLQLPPRGEQTGNTGEYGWARRRIQQRIQESRGVAIIDSSTVSLASVPRKGKAYTVNVKSRVGRPIQTRFVYFATNEYFATFKFWAPADDWPSSLYDQVLQSFEVTGTAPPVR